jgi:hypothetical protein
VARTFASLLARASVVAGALLLPSFDADAIEGGTALVPEAGVDAAEPPTAAALPDGRRYLLLRLRGVNVKWGPPELGTGAVLRYAFVAEEIDRPDATNCRRLGPIADPLPRSALGPADFAREIRRAMDEWSAVADVRFERVSEPAQADLVIGADLQRRGIAYSDLALDDSAAGAVAAIRAAAICFNLDLGWEDRFDGDPATPDVRYVAAHEIGHVLGLDHVWGDRRVMRFVYREAIRAPQRDDLTGAVRLYGARTPAVAVRKTAPTPSSAAN